MKQKFLLLIFSTIPFVLNSCVGIGVCNNHSEKEILSPSGKLKVVLYDRGCGATVGFITGISILPSNQDLSDDDTANVVFAENAVREFWKDDANKSMKGKMNFDAEWINDTELVIYYTDSKFSTKRGKFENIEIKYRPIR